MKLHRKYKTLCYLLLIVCCFACSGCSILNGFIALAKVPFSLLGEVLKVVDKLPKPPPGVF